MKYLSLKIVEVQMSRFEYDYFEGKFGLFETRTGSIFIRFADYSTMCQEWWDKFYTFFGGLDGTESGIYIMVKE